MSEQNTVSRRTLAKGAAWAVPAAAVAVAAPAMATSLQCATITMEGCKNASDGSYSLTLKVCNNDPKCAGRTVRVPIGTIEWMENNSPKLLYAVSPTAFPLTVADIVISGTGCETRTLGTFTADSMAGTIYAYSTKYPDRSGLLFSAKLNVDNKTCGTT